MKPLITHSNTRTLTDTRSDENAPYSFAEWYGRNTGLIPGEERKQYERYLRDWYKSKDDDEEIELYRLKNDYISLLQQLTLAFRNEEDEKWLQDIDWDDDFDIEQAIPYYVKKLKQIALYLVNKREALKKAKLKYNMVGSNNASIRLFYEYILKAFTKRTVSTSDIGNEYSSNITDPDVWATLPHLSAARLDFSIEIEDLYDDTKYFDRDPIVPVSSYFNLSASDVFSFFVNQGWSVNLVPWLYSTGVMNVCADNPLIWSVLDVLAQYEDSGVVPLSAVESVDNPILNDYNRISLTQKYLGSEQNIISSGYYNLWADQLNISMLVGNNWFWWPSGEIFDDYDFAFQLDPIALTNTSLISSGAHGAATYREADRIFVKDNDSIKGAWLYYDNEKTTTKNISCGMFRNRTPMYFPYPGYGVSGEYLDWTGKGFSNLDPTFYYLDNSVQKNILTLYWNTTTNTATGIKPLSIHDTTLIEDGATPGTIFSNADQIIYRPNGPYDITKNEVYNGNDIEYAWLYKMLNTDIPVAAGTNTILWPFERYGSTINFVIPTTAQCAPIDINDIDLSQHMLGVVAGYSLETGDLITKIQTPGSLSDDNIIEVAWLSGATLNYNNLVEGVSQPGLTFECADGDYATFIWEGPDNTVADTVFKHHQHQTDCNYLLGDQFSLYRERPVHDKDHIDYNKWKDCTCKALFYSPLGHPGDSFNDYERMCDYIIADTGNASELNLKNWRDDDNNGIETSSDFAWFNISARYVEPDVGWGPGRWKTAAGKQFKLRNGKRYHYYRSNLNRDDDLDGDSQAPYVIYKYPYSNSNIYKWIGAEYSIDDETWISTDAASRMTINPGDYIVIEHRETIRHRTSASEVNQVSYVQTEVTSQIDYSEEDAQIITTVTQSPKTRVETTITENETQTKYISGIASSVNFMINIPLSGWNYETNAYDATSLGGRPYWAEATDIEDDNTKQKGIDIWGGNKYAVDNYNFFTQPIISNLNFELDSYFEYIKKGDNFTWIQPIDFQIDNQIKVWNKLEINESGVSTLEDVIFNIDSELVVSATFEESDIELNVDLYNPLQINYYAVSSFEWSQRVTNSNLGIPPSGGVWNPILSAALVNPALPYTNLTNRHFPTVATFPYMGDLYATRDVGGYFIPQMIGAYTYVGKYYTNQLNTDYINTLDDRDDNLIFREIDVFRSDAGYSLKTQIQPVSTISIDMYWMKGAITEGYKAGVPVDIRDHQEFIPYQTRYEIVKKNDSGIVRQGDGFDPWTGPLDNTWENPTDWPLNFKKEQNIEGWYNQFIEINNKNIHQWKTDIFGNQYFLIKDYGSEQSIYNRNRMPGTMWVRDSRNVIKRIPADLINNFVYFGNTYPEQVSISAELSSSVRDIDIWFDAFAVRTESHFFIARIHFDYDDGIIFSIADFMHYIPIDETQGQYFGGVWFFDEEKTVTICRLVSSNYIAPELYKLDLNTFNLTIMYNETATVFNNLTALGLTSIEDPVFTYNKDLQKYNIAFEGYSPKYISVTDPGMILTVGTIDVEGDELGLESVTTILPITG
jgi:hypothetical protein